MSFFLRIAATCVLTLASPITAQAQLTEAGMREIVETRIAENHVPGAIVLVQTGGERIVVAQGLADRDSGLAMAPDQLMRTASVGKLHTAAIIHRLLLDEAFTLDTALSTLIDPHWIDGMPNADQVSIRHLLSHTSGIPDYYDENWFATVNEVQGNTPQRTLGYIHGRPADFAPGTDHNYSNSNFQYLGLVAQTVTGLPLGDLYQRMLFDPLGDTRSRYNGQFAPGDVIHGYEAETGADSYHLMENNGPDGGIFTTADDLADLLQALFRPDGRLADLGQSMLSEQIERPGGRGRALGPSVTQLQTGLRFVSHGGLIAGYSTFAAQGLNADLTLIVFINTDRPDITSAIARDVLTATAPALSIAPGPEN